MWGRLTGQMVVSTVYVPPLEFVAVPVTVVDPATRITSGAVPLNVPPSCKWSVTVPCRSPLIVYSPSSEPVSVSPALEFSLRLSDGGAAVLVA